MQITDPIIPTASTLTGWRKSSHSGADQGSCIEVADGYTTVPVRDSKDPHGPALVFSTEAFAHFITAVKDGRFSG